MCFDFAQEMVYIDKDCGQQKMEGEKRRENTGFFGFSWANHAYDGLH